MHAHAVRLGVSTLTLALTLSLFGATSCKGSGCDDSDCATDNRCIAYQGETACRLTCDAQSGATGCPFNYTCIADGGQSFCVAQTHTLEKKSSGQWGAKCDPGKGIENEACDTAQGFYCQASSPTDANAFCTRFHCESDRDCAGGFYCGEHNIAPNAEDTTRILGEVNKVCLPRTYCAPCEHDLDCGLNQNGQPQVCVPDANGKGFCTNSCNGDSQCADEASCRPLGDGSKVCYPVAEVCVGDGGLCSPCLSDADCTQGGVCARSRYSTERNCTVPSKVPCDLSRRQFDCPASTGDHRVNQYGFITCPGEFFDEVPQNHCSGVVPFGPEDRGGYLVGCYAPPRCVERASFRDSSGETIDGDCTQRR